jgi:CSLREA domain-containing protein
MLTVAVSCALLLIVSGAFAQTVFVVNSTDDVDDGSCDGVHCSLREAITAANGTPGATRIEFDIEGEGPHTIRPLSELPGIVDSMTIDGTLEGGFAVTQIIELDGSSAGMAQGLQIVGSGNTIRGLVINRFGVNGIQIAEEATGNVIEGNYIGTDYAGSVALGNANAGVMVGEGGNTIGGTTPDARNVISGNIEGVTIVRSGATGSQVLGNYIGVNAEGNAAVPNNVGVLVLSAGNTVGTPGAGNVISASVFNGVDIGPGVTGTVVEGNFIGTDATGSFSLGNSVGVFVNDAPGNTIGGTAVGAGNIISGNVEGVTAVGSGGTGNQIIGNYIGTNASGSGAIPNTVGILLFSPGNTIGGQSDGAGNLISGNTGNGIDIGPGTTGTLIQGNLIGTDATGTLDLGNDIGVFVNDAPGNTIGGSADGARNVISGGREGVTFWDPGATGNQVLGNYIGTNAAGDAAIPNEFGMAVYSPGNTIGGSGQGEGNVISGNTFRNIKLEGENASGNVIEGNYIGTDATGTAALGSTEIGLLVLNAPDNTIGGTEVGAGNLISGNGEGLSISNPGATGNQVLGNYIGTNAAGTAAIPNGVGVLFWDAPNNIIGGTAAGAGNVISGNDDGVITVIPGATGNQLMGNLIGTNAAGDAVLPNGTGVLLQTSSNIIGGTADGAGNVIAGNALGVILELDTSDNQILGNFIGTDPTGTLDLGNSDIGVLFADGAFNNVIGGTDAGAGNIIAFNGGNGVHLRLLTGTGNTIRSNSIFNNGGFGIDLGSDGVTENDDGDVDTGPNDLLNFPTLLVQPANGDVVITATMNSSPSATYTIEFFSNSECDPSGYGEGMTLLGTASVTTDAAGMGSTTFTTERSALTGNVFTATATDEAGNTSEFSACAAISDFAVAIEPTSRTVTAGESVSYTVKVTAEGGSFDETVTLSCSGMPEDATCSLSEDQVVPGSGEARSVLTIETAAPSKSAASSGQGIPGGPVVAWIGLLSLATLTALGMVRSRGQLASVTRIAGAHALLIILIALLLLQVACGDDDTTAPTGGTPAGTYEFTVTGTWEAVERTGEATLVVE